ncbi:MAG: DUF2905 domain-containing protein [Firmicutes bacterium]|nr:DUF2905 domain-containing protein [Bacillota bacterium]
MGVPGFDGLGRLLIVMGVLLAVVGVVLVFGGRIGLGRLPGDILIQKGNTTFYFPLATMILLSVVLSLILSLIRRP